MRILSTFLKTNDIEMENIGVFLEIKCNLLKAYINYKIGAASEVIGAAGISISQFILVTQMKSCTLWSILALAILS